MKFNRNSVLGCGIMALVGSVLMMLGPKPTNVAMEFGIFMAKCSFVLFMIFLSMEKEHES